jgi:hypothetical protein
MQDEGCRIGPSFYIQHPSSCIQAAFFSSLFALHELIRDSETSLR